MERWYKEEIKLPKTHGTCNIKYIVVLLLLLDKRLFSSREETGVNKEKGLANPRSLQEECLH